MKKLAVVTATRAEYGLLSSVIKQLRSYESMDFKVELIVTGTHLSERYGNTIFEIIKNEVRIDHIVEISVESKTELDISRNQADALVKFTEIFLKEHYQAVMLLGDRYETLAIAIAAGNTRTPVFHLCGGDTTEGAIDEWIRHAITKISYLHFPTNDISAKRVIQMGENPEKVFNYGSTSIDNVLKEATMTKCEALKSIGLEECTYAIATYHPVTMEDGGVEYPIKEFLKAIEYFTDIEFIVTKSNADQGGERINELLDQAEQYINNLHVFYSLGMKRYLSLMRHAEFVIGNSSSGIIETPTFKIPTVNIGDRQRGRLQAESVINCGESMDSIIKTVNIARSREFREKCQKAVSPYGSGHAAIRIASKATEVVMNEKIDLKKKFYNFEAIQEYKPR